METVRREAPEATRLRHALVDALRRGDDVRSPRVEAALRAVPRHLFIPEATLQEAYANEVVIAKRDPDTTVPVSSASQPSIVARMLEQLQVAPGNRVLEIGAGTGYNAALLAYLAGPQGQVTTIDIDTDLTRRAAGALERAGCPQARVILGDGALGHPEQAPYDRIIASVGVWDLPLAWLDQLSPAGRLVAPLRLRGSVTRSIAFERDATLLNLPRWRGVSAELCAFMPLRGGIADDPGRAVPLTPDGSVMLAVHRDQRVSEQALAGVLLRPPTALWSGVMLGHPRREPSDLLVLWLTCTLSAPLSRMSVRPQAVEAGLVESLLPWGMAVADGASLAYLAARQGPDGTREVGVIGHGPRGADLAREVIAQVQAWDRRHRGATVRFTLQPHTTIGPPTSDFAFRTPNCWLSVTWELPS